MNKTSITDFFCDIPASHFVVPKIDKLVHSIRDVSDYNGILYVFEDSTSGADFIVNIINRVNPNTRSRYLVCSGCDIATRKLKSFLEGEPLSDGLHDISYKDIAAIVFVHDMCTAGTIYSDAITSAKYRSIDLYSTQYYSFESVFFTYDYISNRFSKDKRYRDIYNCIIDFCSNYGIYSFEKIEQLRQDIIFRFLQIDPNYKKSFEQLQNTVFNNSYVKLPCVKINKTGYIPLGLSTGNALRFYKSSCTYQEDLYSYCDNSIKAKYCNGEKIKPDILLDMLTSTCLNLGLLRTNDQKTILTLQEVEKLYA